MKNVIWKNVIGFETVYEVSNEGKVRSKMSGRELMIRKQKNGYYRTNLLLAGEVHTMYIHRLVAQAFIDNNEDKKTVNHIDGNKANNCIENLEWMTNKEQMSHSIANGFHKFDKVVRRAVVCYINGADETIFTSISDAASATGIAPSTIRRMIASGKENRGYIFAEA